MVAISSSGSGEGPGASQRPGLLDTRRRRLRIGDHSDEGTGRGCGARRERATVEREMASPQKCERLRTETTTERLRSKNIIGQRRRSPIEQRGRSTAGIGRLFDLCFGT